MYKIWFFIWLIVTIFLLILGITLSYPDNTTIFFGTSGMSFIALLFGIIVYISNHKPAKKMIGGNLAAITLKYILSGLLLIVFIIFFKSKTTYHFFYLLILIFIYSIISYTGAYLTQPEKKK